MIRFRTIAPVAALLAALALAPSAGASRDDVIRDCADDGQFSRTYSHADLKAAHDNLPTDIREYTDCKSLIEAELAKGGGGSPTAGGGPGGAGTAGGVTTASGAAGTPAAVAALKEATEGARKGKPSIVAAGQKLTPVASGLNNVPGAANALPSPLLVAIAAMFALCALGVMAATWRRWPALARATLRRTRR
jgi:hypothetical protein